MTPGLKIIVMGGTRWYNLTLVGWARQVSGDWWELVPGACVILRQRGAYDWNGIDNLAANGPGTDYAVNEPMKTEEPFHAMLVRRMKPANVEAWAKHCPMPKGWGK